MLNKCKISINSEAINYHIFSNAFKNINFN